MLRHYTVSAIALHNDRVLLIQHRKSGTVLPPGGHIDPGEDPVHALRREVREGSASTLGCWLRIVSAILASMWSPRR